MSYLFRMFPLLFVILKAIICVEDISSVTQTEISGHLCALRRFTYLALRLFYSFLFRTLLQ